MNGNYYGNMNRNAVRKPHKKRSGPKVITVIIVLILLVASFGAGYYVGVNYKLDLKSIKLINNNKTDKKDTNETKKSVTKEYNVNDSKISHLVANLTSGVGQDCWAIEEFCKDKKVYASDITNQRAYTIAESSYFYSSGSSIIEADEYIEKVKEFLGQDYRFEPVLVEYKNATCPQYEYHADTKQFIRNPNDCNQVCNQNRTVFKTIKATDTDGILELHIKVLFAAREGNAYYSDFAKTKFVTANSDGLNTAIASGGSYKFIFRNEEGHYAYVSSEPE